MTNIEMHEFIKKLVEAGTEDRFTLLSGKKHILETQTIQKLMEEVIFVKNNTCGHRYKITLCEFIKSSKECRTCLSTHVSFPADGKTVIYNSLHNTQTI